jgi:charged multivesicular body protein 2A
MDETIDETMAEDGDEEEQDAVISKVMDEIGIDLSQQLVDTPLGGAASQKAGVLQIGVCVCVCVCAVSQFCRAL